ncbi:hypothetical protein AAF712_012740 [Marasmius tenuissimus]|uniref:CxC1-like cysteine cluster associated with KDZ transposases domain-containing protein n=1 Tax=Marasmius tenuissimus TaxID=585030 RepID=A0ABR2ZGU0_9AGAR
MISLGLSTISPKKKRSKRNKETVALPLPSLRQKLIGSKLARLCTILTPTPKTQESPSSIPGPSASDAGHDEDPSFALDHRPSPQDFIQPLEEQGNEFPNLPYHEDHQMTSPDDPQPSPSLKTRTTTCKTPAEEASDVVLKWQTLLPTLMDPLLDYQNRTFGMIEPAPFSPHCGSGSCMKMDSQVQLYHFEYHGIRNIHYCSCKTLAQALVAQGFFPTSPSQHRMAIVIPLLDFYLSLSEGNSDAVSALAGALEKMYRRRGLQVVDKEGKATRDPVRRALGHSLEWYDTLSVHVDRFIDKTLDQLKQALPQLPEVDVCLSSPLSRSMALSKVPTSPPAASTSTTSSPTASQAETPPPDTQQSQPAFPHLNVTPVVIQDISSQPTTSPNTSQPQPTSPDINITLSTKDIVNKGDDGSEEKDQSLLKPGECNPYLQRLCPACFGGSHYGRSFKAGRDIHVALDGNFHHRHMKSGGSGVPFHLSERLLTKEYVDAVREHLDAARTKPAKPRKAVVPDDDVDADCDAYKAARGDAKQSSSDRYDHNGLVALVCRHDIPIFLASINTPGEQQKFTVALFQMLFSLLPDDATVVGLYDVACVLDRRMQLYDFLPDTIVSRIQLATAVMHAYGHQWSCQLHYNPRLRPGLGLTDGEGTERLWSRLRRLIGVEQRSTLARRAWLLDRQCDSIARDNREDLGSWMNRKLVKGVQKKETNALGVLRNNRISAEVLQDEWKAQCRAQTSLKARSPAHLKKELSKVIQLQGQILDLKKSITSTKTAIKDMAFPPTDSLFYLEQLIQAHGSLKAKAEGLYESLDLPQDYPELQRIPLEYLHNLLLARDLKYTIRTKAVHSFFEFDRIDGAVGGAHGALGTKEHQTARKAISSRQPALQNLIRRYNQFCAYLSTNYRPQFRIPVPKELLLALTSLQDMETSHLFEDVWILTAETPPRWLVDEGVCAGICALLTLDCAAEERLRLVTESNNMCRWFRTELLALKAMAALPQFACFRTLVNLCLNDHLHLATIWANPFLPRTTLQNQVSLVELHLQGRAGHGQSPSEFTSPDSTLIATERAVAQDEPEVQDIPEAPEDEQTGDAVYLTDVIIEINPELSDNEDNGNPENELVWECPDNLRVDCILYPSLRAQSRNFRPLQGHPMAQRVFYLDETRYLFRAEHLRILDNPTARLDDDCVNGCSALLQREFNALEYAVLSTYAVPELLKPGPDREAAW